MKHYLKLLSVLSTGTLLGCTQFALAPMGGTPVASSASGAAKFPAVQPVEAISSPVSEIEGLFIMGRSAHGAGQLALAEERYAQVLDKQPSHLGALNSIAVIYAQTERTDKALQFFKRALELDAKASHVHNNLGYALLIAGRLAEAEQELSLAHDLNPSSSLTRQNLELLAAAKVRAGAGAVAKTATSEPQLVAISQNVYELRDRAATLPAQMQSARVAAPQSARTAAGDLGKTVVKDLVAGTPLRGVRIEVSNGVGIRHLARRTAERLAPMGVVAARLTNQPRYQQAKTEIQFSAEQQSAAAALSLRLPVAVKTVPSGNLGKNIQLRLVLGHDLVGKAVADWLDMEADTSVARVSFEGWRWS